MVGIHKIGAFSLSLILVLSLSGCATYQLPSSKVSKVNHAPVAMIKVNGKVVTKTAKKKRVDSASDTIFGVR